MNTPTPQETVDDAVSMYIYRRLTNLNFWVNYHLEQGHEGDLTFADEDDEPHLPPHARNKINSMQCPTCDQLWWYYYQLHRENVI